MSAGSKRIICTTVLIETSPQAMPLACACIAAGIRHHPRTAGRFTVELRAFSKEDGVTAADIADSLLKAEPACVCFSVYVWNRALLEQAAVLIQRKRPGTLCVAGGPEITANPFSDVFDYCIAGAGEDAVPALIAQVLDRGMQLADAAPEADKAQSAGSPSAAGQFPPYVYPKGCAVRPVVHAPACVPETLVSPWLDGDIDPAVYGGALWELARGCPYKCSYCYESKGEKRIAYFPEERIVRELELFARKKIPQVFVLDPTYNADRTRALRMIRMIKEKAPGMFFYFEGRAELIDRELARAFASIPCALQIGMQSAHEDVLRHVHRTLDKKLVTRNIGYLNQEGVIFGFDLIYGLPGDTLTGFKQSIDFAMSLYPNNLELFCLAVLPGTALHDTAESLGLVWRREPPYTVIRSKTFDEAAIARAAEISCSCNILYNQGRAVPWFLHVLRPLHLKPSAALDLFYHHLVSGGHDPLRLAESGMSHEEIETLQLEFVRAQYTAKGLSALLYAAEDCIRLNGALSRTQADGTAQTVRLHYHPDDIMSEYAADIPFFVKHARPHPYSARTFMTGQGADWQKIEAPRRKR